MTPEAPVGIDELARIAASVAWELFGLPEAARARQLARLKAEHPALHALVEAHLEDLRA